MITEEKQLEYSRQMLAKLHQFCDERDIGPQDFISMLCAMAATSLAVHVGKSIEFGRKYWYLNFEKALRTIEKEKESQSGR